MKSILLAISLLVFSFTAMASPPDQVHSYQVESFNLVDLVDINGVCASCEMEVKSVFRVDIGAGSGDVAVSSGSKATSKISTVSLSAAFHIEDPGLRS